MKKVILTALLGISTFSLNATSFRDLDNSPGSPINKNDGPVTGVFDIITAGAAPDVGGFSVSGITLSGGTASFKAEADGNKVDSFDVTLDNIFFGSATTAANGVATLTLALTPAILSALQSDGQLNYVITRTDSETGTLKVDFADLTANGDSSTGPQGNPTPDGGSTLALAGIALTALAGIRRQLASK